MATSGYTVNSALVGGLVLSSFPLPSVTLPRTPLCRKTVHISNMSLGLDSRNNQGSSPSRLFALTKLFRAMFASAFAPREYLFPHTLRTSSVPLKGAEEMPLCKPPFLGAGLLAGCFLARSSMHVVVDTGMYHQDPSLLPQRQTVVSWQPGAVAPSRTALLGQPTSHSQLKRRNKSQDTPVQLQQLCGELFWLQGLSLRLPTLAPPPSHRC